MHQINYQMVMRCLFFQDTSSTLNSLILQIHHHVEFHDIHAQIISGFCRYFKKKLKIDNYLPHFSKNFTESS